MKLYCATTNPGKLREFQVAAERFGIEVESVSAPPCEETGRTFEENAIQKALHYSLHAPGPLFADDSGLEVNALDGAPGIYSARYAWGRSTTCQAGQVVDLPHSDIDEANNRLLIEKLRGVAERSARFVCAVALAEKGRLIRTFRGAAEGVIIDTPRGANGFGYDPFFFYPPLGCTFAELDGREKFDVSHRGKALTEMLRYLGNVAQGHA